MLSLVAVAIAGLALVPPPGKHQVVVDQFHAALPSAGNASEAVMVYYPSDLENGPFPVISFAHAMFTGGPIGRPTYRRLLTELASFGHIVVAPESCLVNYCNEYWKDQLAAVDQVKNTSNSVAFAHADLLHVGVVGHGMGGQSSEQNGGPEGAGHNIYATAPLHPHSRIEWAELIHVPAFYTAGTADDQTPAELIRRAYDATTEPGSYFLNLVNASHYECTNFGEGRLDRWTGIFFACHLRMDQAMCQYLNDNICQANNYAACVAK